MLHIHQKMYFNDIVFLESLLTYSSKPSGQIPDIGNSKPLKPTKHFREGVGFMYLNVFSGFMFPLQSTGCERD